MDFLNSFNLTEFQAIMVATGIFLTGIARTGLFGVMILVVPLLAFSMPGREAAGLVLPLMILGDFAAAFYYRKTFNKKAVLRILPWVAVGVITGTLIGGAVSNSIFNKILSVIVFACAGFAVWTEKRGRGTLKLPYAVIAGIGTLSGITSMIGNAAGPIITVYFLALDLKKKEYVSSVVWLFWIINLIKLPLHIFLWGTIDYRIIRMDILALPVLLTGLAAGIFIIKNISEKPFRRFIIASILLSGVMLLLS